MVRKLVIAFILIAGLWSIGVIQSNDLKRWIVDQSTGNARKMTGTELPNDWG